VDLDTHSLKNDTYNTRNETLKAQDSEGFREKA